MDFDFFGFGIDALIVWFVSKFFRIYFETEINHKKEDFLLKYSWIGAIILNAICSNGSNKFSELAFNNFVFAFFTYVVYQLNDKPKSRNYLIAILPVFILGNLVEILLRYSPYLKNLYGETLNSATDFAKFWFIGFGIYAFRQTQKDRLQRQKELEEMRILEAQKSTLEYQVTERTAEILQQKNALEKTVAELKATQNQLIHSEKMASLGELTAGIAHEIQNPLNFVNNFSELSAELCKEIEGEISQENLDKDLIMSLFADLSKNQEKINYHGNRASSIVKGMLMHSRNSLGKKELTDINALADEFLRLSYHGLRAKNKSFQAEFKTDFDQNLPKIPVIPQDFGRVLLNLINNAFYAVGQKYSVETGHALSLQSHYKPTVTVSTQQTDRQIIIKITDNGSGMSDDTKAKIFQPFYTTKPTGQGTGLGLSLAYDIVTKGHGGAIDCESEEGKGTTFTIKIPILNI